MTKKKKIIISSVVVGVVLLSIVLTIILVNIKRFDMRYTDNFDFNNHTTLNVIERDTNLTYYETTYNNGTQKIKNNATSKQGVYSYIDNKNIAEPIYDDVSLVKNFDETHKTYFKLTDNTKGNKIQIIDEKGKDVTFLKYDEDKKITTSEIKTKTIDLQEKNDSVKSKINNRYHNETIIVNSAKPYESSGLTDNYLSAYFMEDLYHYEVWELKTTDDMTYINLYKIENGKHTLIQTLNNETGISLESQNLELDFLVDGTPILINTREIKYGTTTQAIQYEMYDINFNLKGKSQINSSVSSHIATSFRIGNFKLFQTITEATEEKYDFFVLDSDVMFYYNIKTFKINLKNADISEVNFDYLITSATTDFNLQTVLINATKIKDKKLTTQENLLINEKMQTKKIDYYFNTITKVNKNRFITSTDGIKNFNLIDRNYNLITHLENFNSVCATDNAIIVKDSNHTYICNSDGVVIKKMANSNFIYLADNKYYMRSNQKTTDAGIFTYYYLEDLGLSEETPLYTKNPSDYTFNGETYNNIILVNKDYATLVIAVKSTGTKYTYSVYTIDGNHLGNVENISSSNAYIEKLYSDKCNAILKIESNYLVLDR